MSEKSRLKKPNSNQSVVLYTYFVAFQTSVGVESMIVNGPSRITDSNALRLIEQQLSKRWEGPAIAGPTLVGAKPTYGPVKIVSVSYLGQLEAVKLDKSVGQVMKEAQDKIDREEREQAELAAAQEPKEPLGEEKGN